MRAQKLYIWTDIIAADSTHEIEDGANALFDRHLDKCGSVELWEGSPPKCKMKESGEPDEKKLTDNVGIYSIFHASGPKYGPAACATMGSIYVEHVLNGMLGKDVRNITKIVFLACNLAPELSALGKTVHGKTAEDAQALMKKSKLESFMLDVLFNLNRLKCYPKVVGWDTLISILPNLPITGTHTRSVYDKKEKIAGAKMETAEELLGKKYVGLKDPRSRVKYVLPTAADRDLHKRTLRIEKGTVRVSGPPGWAK